MSRAQTTPHGVQTLRHPGYTLAGKRDVDFDGQALSAPLVEHSEGAKPPAADQTVVNEIDRPGLIGRDRPLAHHAQMAQAFAPPPSAQ